MFKETEFKAWAPNNGLSTTAVSTYCYHLRQINELTGGLDSAIERVGGDGILETLNSSANPYTKKNKYQARASLRKYLTFLGAEPGVGSLEDIDEEEEATSPASVAFGLEREMQSAIRRQLDVLEAGLVEADGGGETSVATGRIDILAKDQSGTFVVIELKAGRCPSSALEQLMSYAQSYEQQVGAPVRAMLVASEFSDRTLAAAKWLKRVELKLYEVSVSFRDAITS